MSEEQSWAAHTEVGLPPAREVMLPGGEMVDIFHDAAAVADYLDNLVEERRVMLEEIKRVEAVLLEAMDAALVYEIPFPSGALEKDKPDHGRLSWDTGALARLYDHEPADADMAEAYRLRLNAALRPTVEYHPLKRELDKLAAERPDLAGVVADAAQRTPTPRHVHVRRRG